MNRALAETLKEIWAQYLAGYRAIERAAAACGEAEARAFPGLESYEMVFDRDDTFEMKKGPQHIAKRLVARVVRGAQKAFAPQGGRLDIDEEEFEAAYVTPLEASGAWERFDVVALWDALEARYGGDAGMQASYRQAAERFITLFGLKKNAGMQLKAGKVVLDLRVHIDHFDKKFGQTNLSYHSQNDVVNAFETLREIAAAFDDFAVSGHAARARNAFHRNKAVRSREKVLLGDAGDVTVYSTRFEFRFTPAFAERLRTFLSQYGRGAIAVAA